MAVSTRSTEVANDLERRIRSDEFPAHERLPSLAALAEEYGVAGSTITTALKMLARKNLVTSVRSYGAIVEDWRRPRQIRRNRIAHKDENGYYFDEVAKTWVPSEPASRVTWEPVQEYIADLLGIEYGSEVLIRERAIGEEFQVSPTRRIVNVQQVCSTTVPADIAREHDLAREDTGRGGVLYRLEEIYGPMIFKDVSYARMPTKREVEILQLGSGDTPVLGLATVGSEKGTGRVLVVNDVRMDGRRWFSEHPLNRSASAK